VEDDHDERDFRQPVADVDAHIELEQLRASIDGIASELQDLAQRIDEIGRALDGIGYDANARLDVIKGTASLLLVAVILGIVAVLGTLRHWF
jgi:hypothetical protein